MSTDDTAVEDARAYARARLGFVERLALLLADSGLPRMPARVMAYILSADTETHTAAELARELRVSPAAISGAVRMLVDIRVLAKGRLPADRVDHYRLASDDIWAMMVGRQLPVFDRYDDVFTAGMRMLPRDRQGARRISETREFFHFFRAELVRLNERWANRPRPAVRGAPRPARATPPD